MEHKVEAGKLVYDVCASCGNNIYVDDEESKQTYDELEVCKTCTTS